MLKGSCARSYVRNDTLINESSRYLFQCPFETNHFCYLNLNCVCFQFFLIADYMDCFVLFLSFTNSAFSKHDFL